ncbi:MAG TPA: hypothetical protein ENJ53_03840 [Phaeodactylibacter sp.]|nr:hypothetical protein [Phaeodactylibacter sp.]
MVYSIENKKINSYALKQSVKMMFSFILLVAAIFIIANLYFGHRLPPMLNRWTLYAFLFFLYFGTVVFFQYRNLAKSTLYIISENKISTAFTKNGVPFSEVKNETRELTSNYQVSPHLTISKNEISKITISKNKIQVKSKNYSLFKGRGIVTIPKEVEHFEKIEQHFANLQNELNLL